MGRKPSGNPVGRPESEIDWVLFEQLCSMQCTLYEMAGMLKVHRDTLSDKIKIKYGADFSTVYEKYSQDGKCSLRRNQFVLSKTNAAMAIWLGKQWLGQTDKATEEKVTLNDIRRFVQAFDEIKSGTPILDKPEMASEQSILYQECPRKENVIQA